jgi:hypothetical protein
MITKIYDVAHGFTAYVRDERAGGSLLFDCGYNEETGFYPTDEILAAFGPIGRYFVLNFDEDHLDALPHLRNSNGTWPIHIFHHNLTIGTAELKAMKTRPYGDGLNAVLDIMSTYTIFEAAFGSPAVPVPEYTFSVYRNSYPAFDDTNNLSMVVFVHGPTYSIVFPGDIEKRGWTQLLSQPNFRADLERVNIFVAAHHGRESGYCADVFKYCHPELVIISDEPVIFETQANCYAQHTTTGVPFQTRSGLETRRVLTTRCDGHVTISSPPGYRYFINTEK